jgi:hypothetical protein
MGYLVLDHSACDPAIQREYGRLKEWDTVHCQHCETVVKIIKQHGQPVSRGLCYSCGDLCPNCAKEMVTTQGCVKGSLHFRRRMEAAIQRQALFDAAGI